MINKRQINKRSSNRDRKINWGRIIFRLILVVFLGVVIYLLFFSGKLAVNSVSVAGNVTVEKQQIVDLVDQAIAGKYGKMVSKNNLILINSGKIGKSLEAQFKIIKSVEIRKKFPSALEVSITERKLVLTLCSNDACFSVDDAGQAFERVDPVRQSQGGNQTQILRDNDGKEISIGENVFDADYLNYFSQIAQELRSDVDLEVEDEYETPSRVSGDIRAKMPAGWEIYFNQDIDLKKEVSMLKLVLNDKIKEDQRNDLEYIDLRSDNKVFYKFKDGVEQASDNQNQDNNVNAAPDKNNTKKDDKKKKV